jgi:hypothetical protein
VRSCIYLLVPYGYTVKTVFLENVERNLDQIIISSYNRPNMGVATDR